MIAQSPPKLAQWRNMAKTPSCAQGSLWRHDFLLTRLLEGQVVQLEEGDC